MGVTGLWTIVNPCARPVKLETLAHKRLAVDASIWIYQFLKAVRDKDGNALRSSHVVGFFRRICKLLFFGIRPVFVFDGGAPALKRQTIAGRKLRREGRKEDARRTAKRILALQVQRSADVEAERRKNKRAGVRGEEVEEEEEGLGDAELVYVDELLQTPRERMEKKEKKSFRKADPYHLPDLDVDLENMGAPNDPRIMSQEDLEEYARRFRGGEEINLYDFSNIDFDSAFFNSLPAADRYNILNAARLRSRMRMGLAKEQLDSMFPNRMDFSRFQIERVAERNNLTQRLMNLNGMNEGTGVFDPTRVAGEKGREYVLVKNDGVEGGWALGVVGHTGEREGERNKPIVVDVTEKVEDDEDIDGDEGDFEDVPVEGLNRLPHVEFREDDDGEQSEGSRYDAFDDVETQMLRQALYQSRKEQSRGPNANSNPTQDRPPTEGLFNFSNPLFLDEGDDDDDPFQLDEIDEQQGLHGDEEQLQRAIQMSLEPSRAYRGVELESAFFGRDLSDIEEVEEEEESIGKGKGKAVEKFPTASRDLFPAHVAPGDSDYQRAVSESRRMAGGVKPSDSGWNAPGESSKLTPLSNPFGGLLPFEPLSLGSKSFLIKKKKPGEGPGEEEKEEEKSALLPPWFTGGQKDLKEEMQKAAQFNTPSTVEIEEEEEEEEEEESGLEMQGVSRASQSEEGASTVDSGGAIVINSGDESDEDMLDAHSMEDLGLKTAEAAVDRKRTRSPGTTPEPPVLQNEREIPRTSSAMLAEKAIETWDSDQVLKLEENDRGGAVPARKADAQPTNSPIPPINTSHTSSPPPPGFSEQEGEPLREITPPLEDEDDQYMDPEDLELIQQLALESEEHARFAAELNNKPQQQTREGYERELKSLRIQQAKDRRDADEVTQVMVQECQQLLTLFGIPYITAPMEAEAQCAELVHLGLVDGIITDDSDTFLFGGTRIYKNMFSQSKYVECYLASDLEREFALDRGRLIRIAHLLGSDYTEGIPSVGPVTALELLAEFSSDDGLAQFRDWWTAVQTGLCKPADDGGSKFRKKFRKNSTKIFLPTNFPDRHVDDAYLNPEVDKDPSEFEWGVPDLDGLRVFLMATVGWSQERTDEVLVPVVRDMNKKQFEGTQRNITQFFDGGTGAGAFAPQARVEGKSKRMERAMLSLHEQAKRKAGIVEPERGDDEGEQAAEQSAKRKRAPAKKRKAKKKSLVDGGEDGDDDHYEDGNDEEYLEDLEKDVPGVPTKRRKTAARRSKKKT